MRPCAGRRCLQVEVETGFVVVKASEVGVFGRGEGVVEGGEGEEGVVGVVAVGVGLGRVVCGVRVGGLRVAARRDEVGDCGEEGREERFEAREAGGCYADCHFGAAVVGLAIDGMKWPRCLDR